MNSRLGPPPTRNPATMTTTMGRHALIPTATSLLLLTVLGGGVAAWSANTPPSRSSRSQPLSAASISRSGRGMSTSRRNAARESPLEESPSGPRSSSRRAFLSREMTSAVGAATLFSSCLLGDARSSVAVAAEEVGEEDLIDVYFGCGCFWHVQHEFVQAERSLLSRPDASLTSRAGYAGGKAGSLNGKVCYHNAADISDYGKLGHAEVVSLRIPSSKFEDFAVEYCKLFDERGFRPDQFGDRGGEYRNLVGVPGGSKSKYAESLIRASKRTGDKLDFAVGKGDDGDVAKVVFVMDTTDFPFFKAEKYHQFHDGFNWGEDYSRDYNGLAGMFQMMGEDFGKCPNGMVGLGVGGL